MAKCKSYNQSNSKATSSKIFSFPNMSMSPKLTMAIYLA